MSLEGLKLDQYSSHHAEKLQTREVSIEEEIAYVTRFYPSPKFVEMDFNQTQASSNQTSNSHKSQVDSQESAYQSSVFSKPEQKQESVQEYEVSQIKANNFGMTFNINKQKQKDIKSFNQSEFDYKYLLDELSFQEKVEKEAHFSAQKDQNEFYHFQLEEKDKSFVSESKRKFSNVEENQEGFRQKLVFTEKNIKNHQNTKVEYKFKWDPPCEALFKRQNKVKRLVNVLNNKTETMLVGVIKKLKYEASIPIYQKCQKQMKKHQKKKLCHNCRPKQENSLKMTQVEVLQIEPSAYSSMSNGTDLY